MKENYRPINILPLFWNVCDVTIVIDNILNILLTVSCVYRNKYGCENVVK